MNDEIPRKESLLRDVMQDETLDGIMLFRRDTFSWMTAGRINHIVRTTELGFGVLLITKNKKYCIANQVEKYRLMNEELYGLGFELLEINWWEEDYIECVRRELGNIKLGADIDAPGIKNVYQSLKKIRYSLMPEEIDRYRKLSELCVDAVESTCLEISSGETEHEICANLVKKAMSVGVEASVALVASDERIRKYRHPIDTAKKVENHVMVVLCGRKYGLFANLTRIIHFGRPPKDIIEKHNKVIKIDAEYMTNSIVGRKVSDVFQNGVNMYTEAGYPDEWRLLHQGGPTGYDSREFIATFKTDGKIHKNQAFTWNPSITGTKSEDTILVNENGFEILTLSKKWPYIEVEANNGMIVKRPDILVR